MPSTERILNLLYLLLTSAGPRSLDEIFDLMGSDYAGNREACERTFHRDRDVLRSLGIEVVYDQKGRGYGVDHDSFYLDDLSFTPQELATLVAVGSHAAKRAFPMRGELKSAITKLKAATRSLNPQGFSAVSDNPLNNMLSNFADLATKAVRERRRLRIRYGSNKEQRAVDPWVLAARQGRFAVVGYCHNRQGIRVFYLDRMDACELDPHSKQGAQFEVPENFRYEEHLPRYSWQLKIHDPIEVELEFSPELANVGPSTLGIEGSTCITTNLDGLIGLVLALGPGARIVGPKQAKDRVREQIGKIRAMLKPESAAVSGGGSAVSSDSAAELLETSASASSLDSPAHAPGSMPEDS